MALFFDGAWFDARLRERGLGREDVARALGLTTADVADMWKDQRELLPRDVRVLSQLVEAAAAEVASRAGVSTPTPREDADAPSLAQLARQLDDVDARLARLERAVQDIKTLLLSPPPGNRA